MKTKRTIFTRMKSPIGPLLLVADDDECGFALRGIYFTEARAPERGPRAAKRGTGSLRTREAGRPTWVEGRSPMKAEEDARPFEDVVHQLEAYFSGKRTTFDIPLAPRGTPFQRDVWRALETIPYGTTRTYSEIARSIGRPRAVRAVGAANGQNPLSIVVPCHRVIGKDGTLTGYAGGIENKRALLSLESRSAR